jgi:uracil permease
VPIALATIMEHIGDIMAIGATTRRNYILEPGLHRTLLGDGLATSLSSAFGGPANTTYGENTGVLVLTRVFDPVVMRIAALFAIVASFFPAIEAVISSIPGVVIGGISFILYGMISAIGVRTLVENQVDLTKTRNLVVAALILVSGLGFDAIGGLTIPIGDTQLVFSGLAIAAIVGIVLNAILPGKDYEFKVYDEDGNEQPVE